MRLPIKKRPPQYGDAHTMFDRILMRRSASLLGLLTVLALTSCGPRTSPLDEYVAAPDPAFTYDEVPATVVQGKGYTASVYIMTSQKKDK